MSTFENKPDLYSKSKSESKSESKPKFGRHTEFTRKFTGRPPFTENDVYINRGKYTLYVVLPDGTAMTPCHNSKSTLVDIVNRTYSLLAKQRWSRRN